MEEGVEFQRLGNLLVQIAGSEFSSEDERWVVAERRMMAMARNGGPTSMGHLLGLLRRADLPEKVADLVAKAISLCCGPCAAPPAVRSFIFSPSLSVQAPVLFPKVAEHETFDWVIGSDLLYDQQCLLSLADVINRRLSAFGKALIVTPVRDKELLDQFLKEVDRLGMATKLEQIDQQEWNSCKLAMHALDGDDLFDEYGTMHDMGHYEGGILALFIAHKIQT